MTSDRNRTLIQVIDELCALYQDEKAVQAAHLFDAESTFENLCDEILEQYDREKESLGRKITAFIEKNRIKELSDPSFLGVIGKLEKETQHSLFLKYIWDSSHGADALRSFLTAIPEINDMACWQDIAPGSYTIDDECNTFGFEDEKLNKKRIDLLLLDNNYKWMVAIENKVNASVSKIPDTPYTQIQVYHKFCEREYRKYQNRIYILLSKNEANEAEAKKPWIFVNYHPLFRTILQHSRHTQDPFVKDHLKTMFQILYGKEMIERTEEQSLYQYRHFYNDMMAKVNVSPKTSAEAKLVLTMPSKGKYALKTNAK